METEHWTPRWGWKTAISAAVVRSLLIGIPSLPLVVLLWWLEGAARGRDGLSPFLGFAVGWLVGRGLVNRTGMLGRTLSLPVTTILAATQLLGGWLLWPLLGDVGEYWFCMLATTGLSAVSCYFCLHFDQS